MEMTWDLSVFYKSFDDPQLENDIQRVAELSHSAQTIAAENISDTEKLEKMVAASSELSDLLSNAYGFTQLTLATDCTNEDALRYLDRLSNMMVDVQLNTSAMVRLVGGIAELEACIANSEVLTQHAFMLRETKEQAEHLVDGIHLGL